MNRELSVTPRQTPAIANGEGQGIYWLLAAGFMFWPAHWLSCGLAFTACSLAVIRILKLKPTFPNRLEAMLVVGLFLGIFQAGTAVRDRRRSEQLRKVMTERLQTKPTVGTIPRVPLEGASTNRSP